MELDGKNVAMFAEDYYEDHELWYPYYRLQEAGAEVTIFGTGDDTYKGKMGNPVEVDDDIENASVSDFDALVIPGGYSPDRMRRNEEMVSFVREMNDADKPIAAICHAGWMLCSAGIIDGVRATSFFSIKDDMVNAGCDWVDEECVRDGNIITSRNPDDLPAFCKTIIGTLQEQ